MQQLDPKKFLNFIKSKQINFFAGVPDSLLKNFLSELDPIKQKNHIIAANEGSAVSVGIGYFLATKKIPCIYMQNSGLGNAINPLASLAHENVYSIPMLLIIGWRGSPSFNDEPQHKVKGKITPKILRLLKIKYLILSHKKKNFNKISKLINYSKKKSKPVAIIVEKNTFFNNKTKINKIEKKSVYRREIIEILLKNINKNTKLISTTGYTSRELNQIRFQKKLNNGQDFYLVGGMGHATSVAIGVALKKKNKIICLDGDGSLLMHLGSLTTVGYFKNENFIHILFNNKVHESVGGQKIFSKKIDFKNMILSLGYRNYYSVKNKNEFERKIKSYFKTKGPTFIDISTKVGILKNLKRPKNLKIIKKRFFGNF